MEKLECLDVLLHGVHIKRPRGRPKKRLRMDYCKATYRFRVAVERYYCLACNAEEENASTDVPLL